MPRMTLKYKAALPLAHRLEVAADGDQNDLYRELERLNWHWNSDTGQWEQWADQPADDPTEFISIRVWADAEIIPEAVEAVVHGLQSAGLRLVEQSPPYPCRPPKHLEARVYLKFLPNL